MKHRWFIVAGIVLAVVLLPGGAIVGAVTVYQRRRKAGFIADLAGEVERQLGELRPDLTDAQRARSADIVAALGALESGYGRTRQYRDGFNFGNVSRGSWQGPTIAGGDKEFAADGSVRSITQEWRRYASLAEAVSDFITLLGWSRYRAARDALFRGDSDGFAAGLRSGGYFTAPLAEYQAGLRAALPEAAA